MDGIVLNTDVALCNESKNVHLLLQVRSITSEMPFLGASWDYFFPSRNYLIVRGVV